MVTPARLFYSYSQEDVEFRDELEKHLTLLQRQGVIDSWHDQRILPGHERDKQIAFNLDSAAIILLLVSADFLASDYCYKHQMKRALELHEASTARVIPVILRPVDWSGAPFGYLQALPRDGQPVSLWPNRDEAWCDVVRGIRQVLSAEHAAGNLRLSESSGRATNRYWSKCVRTQLPVLLLATGTEPRAVLVRTDVPAQVGFNSSLLDQWTYLCDWLASSGTPGIIYTLRIINDVQSVNFNDPLSRWAADFIAILIRELRGGGDGDCADVILTLKLLIDCETERWTELRRRVHDIFKENRISRDALDYVVTVAGIWEHVSLHLSTKSNERGVFLTPFLEITR